MFPCFHALANPPAPPDRKFSAGQFRSSTSSLSPLSPMTPSASKLRRKSYILSESGCGGQVNAGGRRRRASAVLPGEALPPPSSQGWYRGFVEWEAMRHPSPASCFDAGGTLCCSCVECISLCAQTLLPRVALLTLANVMNCFAA